MRGTMSWYSFRPYVSAGARRRQAEMAAKKLAKKGRALAPVRLASRMISSTFWGKSWCDNLESYSDYANRLPRGRTYVRHGSVIDLQIAHGKIEALVQGSDLYRVSITIRSLGAQRWEHFKQTCAGKLTNLLDLLQGRLSAEILTAITTPGTGLFPSPREITLNCSCPDWAGMCKHLAAVLYGVGARLDTKPEMFFVLRGVAMEDLIAAASASAVSAGDGALAAGKVFSDASLSEIFGVDIETAPEPKLPPAPTTTKPVSARRRKSRAPKGGIPQLGRKLPVDDTAVPSKKRASRRAGKPGST
jgi:uncharacterized Zn finger protein